MKIPVVLILLFATIRCFSQEDTLIANQLALKDSIPSVDTSVDNRPRNAYGDLLNDDPAFNKRYSPVYVGFRIAFDNASSWAISRYAFNYEWSKISLNTWKRNLKSGWEWDADDFGTNFLGHPYAGNNYFNTARSNGYNFWQAYPFAVGGSLMWEYFGENTKPSKNDIINTSTSGAFLGEVLYRISSNVLDDRKRGGERVLREFVAGIINPSRALNRLTQGKMFRVTNKEVYQKEPLNLTINAGMHKVNNDNKFGTGSTNAILSFQFDYGDPFEVRHRKPFDVFRLRLDLRYGDEKKIMDHVLGYGLLFGKNIVKGKHGLLTGIFQHYDYWNNKIFEIGSLGFGPGIISKIDLGTNSKLYSGLHIAGVPLAGYNTRFGPDTSEYRDYPFGGGFESRIEETLHMGRWVTLGFNGYYYHIWNYEGSKGKTHIGILKPRIALHIINNLDIGIEHQVYYDKRFLNDQPTLRLRRTEQKFFVQLFLEDGQRKGKYQ